MLLTLTGISQTKGWGKWEKMYEDQFIKVEIQFYYSENSCEDGGKQFKYRMKKTGLLKKLPLYLNWKFDYISCDGKLCYMQKSNKIWSDNGGAVKGDLDESMDYAFTASDIVTKFYDVKASSYENTGQGVKPSDKSIDPKRIIGDTNIFMGKSTVLEVIGGLLGIGAEWYWYQGACGTGFVGKGKTINISPTDNTTYYVRAEGSNNSTNCVHTTVNVDKRSTAPERISGDPKICQGESTTLFVEGGSLGWGADWYWYENDTTSKSFAQGKNVILNLNATKTIYVRAEGPANKTRFVSQIVTVYNNSADPSSITLSGNNTICEGDKVTLFVQGGKLASDASWKWYADTYGSMSLGTGESIILSPKSTTTYKVKGEGLCNSTKYVTKLITVNKASIKPDYIGAPTSVYKGKKTELTRYGGLLGEGAQWKWYKGSCGGDLVGTGNAISIKIRKPERYYLRAEGMCNKTNCVEKQITPIKLHYFDDIYSDREKKFLNIAIGIGLELGSVTALTNHQEYDLSGTLLKNENIIMTISGIGLKGDFTFHPIIKDYLSLGLTASYTIGTTPMVLVGGSMVESYKTTKINYFYQRLNAGGELAFGFNPAKVLLKFNIDYQPMNYKKEIVKTTIGTNKYISKQTFKKETICAGFRLGRYKTKNSKRGQCFDITYNMSQNAFNNDFNLKKWNVGAGICWWIQSAFKLEFNIGWDVQQQYLKFSSMSSKNTTYQISLIYNRNWFY